MKVERIQHYRDLFVDHIQQNGLPEHLYRYEAQQVWQQAWDIEELDFPSMYDRSLQSSISGRLWGGSKNSAKESMLAMLRGNKEFIRSAFRDLLAVEKDLGLRCDRFLFYCDEAIKPVLSRDILEHKHDRQMMAVYLTLAYPAEYCLYHYDEFLGMMQLLEARNIPTNIELERYMKSMKAIYGILRKDDVFVAEIAKALGPYYAEDSILPINEFAKFVNECNVSGS